MHSPELLKYTFTIKKYGWMKPLLIDHSNPTAPKFKSSDRVIHKNASNYTEKINRITDEIKLSMNWITLCNQFGGIDKSRRIRFKKKFILNKIDFKENVFKMYGFSFTILFSLNYFEK